MSDRKKIAARIRALLAKTVENGCTEDEAIAAAEKVAEMLARYNMTIDEAQIRESEFARYDRAYDDAVGERLWKPADAIAMLTGCRYWTSPVGVFPVSISFFGFDHEVAIASYLLAICTRAMRDEEKRQMARYALLVHGRRRGKVTAFLDGMADSLRRRILALKPTAPTGSGLVVLRNELIDAAMPVKLKDRPQRQSRDFEDTYEAGVRAGERVPLNHGVQGPSTTARLIT